MKDVLQGIRVWNDGVNGGLWVHNGLHDFTGNAGENVCIGIVDTGIDVAFPGFSKLATSGSRKGLLTSRIEAIWDMGMLDAEFDTWALAHGGSGATRPKMNDTSIRDDRQVYGYEFTQQHIEGWFDWAKNTPGYVGQFVHEDRSGHGTQVAIAAASHGSDRKDLLDVIGSAPTATLLIVKKSHDCGHRILGQLPGLPHDVGSIIGNERVEDAIMWCFKRAGSRPCVVNLSKGSIYAPSMPSEELEAKIEKLTKRAKKTDPARIVINAAGNNGTPQTALKTAAGTDFFTAIEFELDDTRKTTKRGKDRPCIFKTEEPPYGLVRVEFIVDGDHTAADTETSFKVLDETGHPLGKDAAAQASLSDIRHEIYPGTRMLVRQERLPVYRTPGKTYVQIWVKPYTLHDPKKHAARVFKKLKFWLLLLPPKTAPSIMELSVTAGRRRLYGCKLTGRRGSVSPSNLSKSKIPIEDIKTWPFVPMPQISQDGFQSVKSVLTVGSFDSSSNAHSGHSSFGPLLGAPHIDNLTAVLDKPNIMAPGVSLPSSKPSKTVVYDDSLNEFRDHKQVPSTGTSMASPIAAGVIACLLNEHASLSAEDAIHILQQTSFESQASRAGGTSPTHDPMMGYGRIDALAAETATKAFKSSGTLP